MSPPASTVGWVGLGAMGLPMATVSDARGNASSNSIAVSSFARGNCAGV